MSDSVEAFMLGETEEEMEARMLRIVDPTAVAWERAAWKGARMKYEQTERLIEAINGLAARI